PTRGGTAHTSGRTKAVAGIDTDSVPGRDSSPRGQESVCLGVSAIQTRTRAPGVFVGYVCHQDCPLQRRLATGAWRSNRAPDSYGVRPVSANRMEPGLERDRRLPGFRARLV